ncbi:hypothetical protein [Streptomyces hokutonensis]
MRDELGAGGTVVGTLTLVLFPVPSGLPGRVEGVLVNTAARSRTSPRC